jgi:hypothetical protein
MGTRTMSILVGGLVLCGALPASASCRIKNETATSFTVASGNTPNQRVSAHATTTIAPGKVQGHSEDGKSIAGVCKDGGDLVIKEKNGVPLLGAAPKAKAPKGADARRPRS